MVKSIMIMPAVDADFDPGDKPITPLFVELAGADPDREVPGFFIIQIDGKPIWPHGADHPEDEKRPVPQQFPSLKAVHAFLQDRYGWRVPLHVTHYAKTSDITRCPVVWGAFRRLRSGKRVTVRSSYLGSFYYWSGRPVDPTRVGTAAEFN